MDSVLSRSRSPSVDSNGNGNAEKQKEEGEKEEKQGTKLSLSEFRAYNRLAEHMEQFHNHFRLAWSELYGACTDNKEEELDWLSARRLIQRGLDFCSQLGIHHAIEEGYLFPELARRMPDFRPGCSLLLDQHGEIHAGMDRLEAYLRRCMRGKIGREGDDEELRLEEVKRLMDGFGEVLWRHLDEEVRALRAENMRRYWSLEEVRRLPI